MVRAAARPYVVYAAGAGRSLDLAEQWSQRRAERALSRLREALFGEATSGASDDSPRRAAQERVDAERARQRAQTTQAQAQVDAYYRSGAFRRAGIWIGVGLVAYLLAMVGYTYFTGQAL
jgi:hypothetical protein